jgi:DNA-binding XRE family transcriptional regulator
MKGESKYKRLYDYLHQKEQSEITLSFSQIEILINSSLPDSARSKRAWWSNRKKGGLQAQAWMMAGYEVKTIDLDREDVTFRKPPTIYQVERRGDTVAWDSTSISGLRRHMGLTQVEFARTLGVRQATVSDWERGSYPVKLSTAKHLSLVAEQAGFQYRVRESEST